MHNIYSALTTSNSLSAGIKGMDVFYNTLFVNVKTFDDITTEKLEYLLIEKLNFNYDNNSFNAGKSAAIGFGDSGFTDRRYSNGNMFVKNVLIDDEKSVLIFGLSSNYYDPITTTLNSGQIIAGRSIVPLVYKYSLNTGELKKIYPKNDYAFLYDTVVGESSQLVTEDGLFYLITEDDYLLEDQTITYTTTALVQTWSTFVMGQFLSAHTPVVDYDKNTNKINFLIKTNVYPSTSTRIDVINNLEFHYNGDISLTSVKQLTSTAVSNNAESFNFVGVKLTDNGKLIISYKNNAIQLFKLNT